MSAAWPTGNHRHMIFFPEDATTTEIYTLSLHDALPISYIAANRYQLDDDRPYLWKTSNCGARWRSEEHTSELQSQSNLVCPLLLDKQEPQGGEHPPADASPPRILLSGAFCPRRRPQPVL